MRGHRTYLDIGNPHRPGKFYVPPAPVTPEQARRMRGPILPMEDRKGLFARMRGRAL
ncbi:DNA-binding protein [Sphingopyxis sp. 113P3]|nr:DNA-binding protein [Sphingopyxis sp. 113P3]